MSHGRSLRLTQNTWVDPPQVSQPQGELSPTPVTRRSTNLYDVVAGRFGNRGRHAATNAASHNALNKRRPLRPEEVLLRREHAVDFEAKDSTYFANETLPTNRPLPSSDLLEAIHAYVADHYEFTTEDQGQSDYKTMDETALIAMGVLIEELAKEALGETGDLVLVEGQELSDDEDSHPGSESDSVPRPVAKSLRRKRSNTTANPARAGSQHTTTGVRKKHKRRRLSRAASTTDFETE
ncbi:uncharacterized protein PFLUO_LOCUS7864 [Penicillium psychrofluorescens]|uniref:uncharacterized protein n=1 Tax=Penicillium psychrofluorescens TaxID=3158075 RepID=UPI003CCDB27A